jgi:hypothetical protein
LEIVLLEVKHGEDKLAPVQRAVAVAVEAGRVRFEVAHVVEDGIVTIKSPVSKRQKEIGLRGFHGPRLFRRPAAECNEQRIPF